LSDTLRPAPTYTQLSPADRVFGWVNRNGMGSHRGNLRIGQARCSTPAAVDEFKYPGLPLAILGQPKPQQARFYVSGSNQGEAQTDGLSKEDAGYLTHKGLRGRKVYPHHAGLPDGYWIVRDEDRTQEPKVGQKGAKFYQEYRRPHKPVMERGAAKLNEERTGFILKRAPDDEQRDDQNRSVIGWVKPGAAFQFEIAVTNLSNVEFGALLWLFALPDDHFHRLGGGKPLGFGSVRLEADWDNSDVRSGKQWRTFYSSLKDDTNDLGFRPTDLIADYKNAVASAYRADFDSVSFIEAFKRSAQGFTDGKPIHYPRAKQQGQNAEGAIPPHPEGKAFEWFVANERTGRVGGPKASLADLADDEGLPILETR